MSYSPKLAVRVIERAWSSYRNRQMFRLLKHAICAAEQSLSHELLRKLAPNEARFAEETKLSLRLRLRLGGTIFPPRIYFKVYLTSANLQYISGANEITMKESASREACALMGNRNYSQILMLDQLQSLQTKNNITFPDEVVTLKDYMRYKSNLDERRAELGGKNNAWRLLNLEDVPCHRIFHDVVDYAYNGTISLALRQQMPLLLAPPTTAEVMHAQIQLLASRVSRSPAKYTSHAKSNDEMAQRIRNSVIKNSESSRRKKQALARAEQMKAVFLGRSETSQSTTATDQKVHSFVKNNTILSGTDHGGEDEDEAAELYEWSRSLDEMNLDRAATSIAANRTSTTTSRQTAFGQTPNAHRITNDGSRN